MIKLAVFDLAGTTVRDDDGVRHAFHAALQSENIPASDTEISRVMGLPKPEAIRQLVAQAGREASSEKVHRIHQIFVHKMQEYYAHHPDVAEISGASQIFA
ncbi:MAG TPA: HAD hydrolase-like protein, partial [Gemmatales bacterium]|nr:HAD hydrolase-like protein [Gemmatales bacterium]